MQDLRPLEPQQLTLFDFGCDPQETPVAALTPLTAEEAARRIVLEAHVKCGFLQVALALTELRTRCLWRDTHYTWTAYCLDVLDMTKQRANQLIAAATVVEDLSGEATTTAVVVLPLPTAEAQARELVPLTPEQRREVWMAATAETDNPTGPRLRELAAEVRAAAAVPVDAEWEPLPLLDTTPGEPEPPPFALLPPARPTLTRAPSADMPRHTVTDRLRRWLQEHTIANDALEESGFTPRSLRVSAASCDWKALREELIPWVRTLRDHYNSYLGAIVNEYLAAPEFRISL